LDRFAYLELNYDSWFGWYNTSEGEFVPHGRTANIAHLDGSVAAYTRQETKDNRKKFIGIVP